ncbi:hypothetical protein V6N13_135912 [Hibiscus sabdariffa]
MTKEIHRPNCSHLWKGISLVWSSVRDGLIWNVGDGRAVNCFRDAWLGDLRPLVEHDCAAYLPVPILHRLAATLPPQPRALSDEIGWKWTASHAFTVKSAYELCTSYHDLDGYGKCGYFGNTAIFVYLTRILGSNLGLRRVMSHSCAMPISATEQHAHDSHDGNAHAEH